MNPIRLIIAHAAAHSHELLLRQALVYQKSQGAKAPHETHVASLLLYLFLQPKRQNWGASGVTADNSGGMGSLLDVVV
jgi:hypothetical protein